MTVETEIESKKPRVSKEKEALLKTVEGLGISTEGLSESELLKKVVGEFTKANNQLAAALSDSEEDLLNKYVNGIEHNIKSKELLKRLFYMSVPSFYLHLFRDEDMVLTDSELWAIVNDSGINPFNSVQDLFNPQKSFLPKGKKKLKRG